MFLVGRSNLVDSMITVLTQSAQQYSSIIYLEESIFAALLSEFSTVNWSVVDVVYIYIYKNI